MSTGEVVVVCVAIVCLTLIVLANIGRKGD